MTSALLDNKAQVPRVVALTFLPTRSEWEFHFSILSLTLGTVRFEICQNNGYIVLSYSFNLHCPDLFNEIEHLFIFNGTLISFRKTSFQTFCPLRKLGHLPSHWFVVLHTINQLYTLQIPLPMLSLVFSFLMLLASRLINHINLMWSIISSIPFMVNAFV